MIIDEQTGRVVADLHSGTPRVILKGGRGGKGNAKFTTPTRQTPRFALPGRKTLARKVILELKSIADVGLVGFPSVGQSTLLSVVSDAVSVEAVSVEAAVSVLDAQAARDRLRTSAKASAMI